MTETENVNGLRESSGALYEALMSIGESVGARLPFPVSEEAIHDAATRIMERMRRRPDYEVKSIRELLRREIRHFAHDRKKVKYETTAAPLDESMADERASAEILDSRDDFAELIAEERGAEACVIIYLSSSFRGCAKSLELAFGRKWVYNHAREVRSIYLNTRGGKWSAKSADLIRKRGKSGSSLIQLFTPKSGGQSRHT